MRKSQGYFKNPVSYKEAWQLVVLCLCICRYMSRSFGECSCVLDCFFAIILGLRLVFVPLSSFDSPVFYIFGSDLFLASIPFFFCFTGLSTFLRFSLALFAIFFLTPEKPFILASRWFKGFSGEFWFFQTWREGCRSLSIISPLSIFRWKNLSLAWLRVHDCQAEQTGSWKALTQKRNQTVGFEKVVFYGVFFFSAACYCRGLIFPWCFHAVWRVRREREKKDERETGV